MNVGCDWHVDGGIRGYKIWVPLSKEHGARNRTNIVVAPMNHAQQLCEIADKLEASVAHTATATVHVGAKGEWQMASDSDGERGWKFESSSELIARARDRRALEAIGCTIPADPGDLLLFFPGIYHRTQDLSHARVAIIAEATQA